MTLSDDNLSESSSDYEDVFSYAPTQQFQETEKKEEVDLESIYPKPMFHGKSIYEIDIDKDLESRPWRDKDADLTDYFNYGLTEETWKRYAKFKLQENTSK